MGATCGQKPTAKEMGAVMKAVQARLQAPGVRAEGRAVGELVKKVLAEEKPARRIRGVL